MLIAPRFTTSVRRFILQRSDPRVSQVPIATARRLPMARFVAAVAVAALLLGTARADEVAIAPPTVPHNGFAAGLVFGWQFSPLQDVQVTALGWFDHDQDGFLNGRHAVGMFRVSDQSLLVDALVESGSALVGDYRYESVSPTLLSAGEDYIVAGFDPVGADDRYPVGADLGNMNLHPQLAFQQEVVEEDAASLVYPDDLTDGTAPWQLPANFQFVVVPEPHSAALVAVLCLVGLSRRRRKAA